MNAALGEITRGAGGTKFLENDFIPMRATAALRAHNKTLGINPAFRGVLIPGGAKMNADVKLIKGELSYRRGDGPRQTFVPVDAQTERRFRSSMKKTSENMRGRFDFITLATYSGEIKTFSAKTAEAGSVEVMRKASAELWNRYAGMTSRGETRTRKEGNRTISKGLAAHPSKWGLGLLGVKVE